MKQQCDNHCETCPMPTQLHCVVVFSRATNESIGALAERIDQLEKSVRSEQSPIINPLAMDYQEIIDDEEESEKLPAPEVGA